MLNSLLRHNKIIGMIHLLPLPATVVSYCAIKDEEIVVLGSPGYQGGIKKIFDQACKEAEIFAKYNIGGVLVENMNDIPYVKSNHLGPETISTMTKVCVAVRNILPESVAAGIQVLAGGNKEGLAIALACNFEFIRAEGFIFGHLADEGYIDACAGPLLRYRNNLRCNDIQIFTDIKKKHSSHAITSDLKIEDVAKAAEFFLTDGVILTGASTGDEANPEDLRKLKSCTKKPVIIGSGVNDKNISKFMSADALIIGSHFKVGGRWENELDEKRIVSLLDKYYSSQ